jgi:GNAT superfamily N-acetyltransferase
VHFVELNTCTDAAERASLCHAFCKQVYDSAFPDKDGAEDCGTWLPLLGADPPDSKPRVYITLAIDLLAVAKGDLSEQQLPEPRILGGIVFEYYRNSRTWLITYLAVDPSTQGRGIGSSLVRRALHTVQSTLDPEDDTAYIFAEVETPRGETEIAYRRIGMLENFGFMRLKLDYTQPALSPNKHALPNHYSLLAHMPPEDFPPDLDGQRVSAFLEEFYTSLGERDSQYLKQMMAELHSSERVALLPLSLDLPACYDETFGRARSITVQLLFFTDLFAASDPVQTKIDPMPLTGFSRKDGAEQSIDLRDVRQRIQTHKPAALLTDAVESYHKDIVVPFVSEATMPLVICCEPFGGRNTIEANGTFRRPVPVWIDFPKEFEINWEMRTETRRVGPVADVSIAAEITDFVALFQSGIAAYGISIILEPDEFMPRVNATELLLIESLVGAAGTADKQPTFRKRYGSQPRADAAQNSQQLDCFVRDVLMEERFRAKSDRTDGESIFTLFESPLRFTDNVGNLAEKLRCFTFGDPVKNNDSVVVRYAPNFAAVEIVGSERHDDVIHYARAASLRNVPVDQFSKRLAGIVQNVLDFDTQDSIEIQDSLLLNQQLGSEISFVHARVIVWFGSYRRAYFESRTRLGSDPYWLLVRLVLGHNEHLLVMLQAELERLESRQPDTNTGIAATKRLHAIRRRMERYIRDPFRYPSERRMYEFASDLRGVERQRELLEAEQQTLFARVQEDAVREKEQIDARINKTLIAIGVIQAAGVLIAVLSLQLYPFHYLLTHKVIVLDERHDPLTNHPVMWLIFGVLAAVLLISGFFYVVKLFVTWRVIDWRVIGVLKRAVGHFRRRSMGSTRE